MVTISFCFGLRPIVPLRRASFPEIVCWRKGSRERVGISWYYIFPDQVSPKSVSDRAAAELLLKTCDFLSVRR